MTPPSVDVLPIVRNRASGCSQTRPLCKNLSILRDFFKFHVLRGNLHGDPTLPIERAKKRAVLRENFSANTRNPLGFKPDLG